VFNADARKVEIHAIPTVVELALKVFGGRTTGMASAIACSTRLAPCSKSPQARWHSDYSLDRAICSFSLAGKLPFEKAHHQSTRVNFPNDMHRSLTVVSEA